MTNGLKIVLGCAVLAVALAAGALADTIDVTVAYTGDNVVGAAYQNGGAPVSITGVDGTGSDANWRISDSFTLSLTAGHEYQVVFRVQNDDLNYPLNSKNPAGFLAELTTAGGWSLATDATWEVALVTTSNMTPGSVTDGFNGSAYAWSSATVWGYNGQSTGLAKIWYDNNSNGPVSGIASGASGAKWLWTDDNFTTTTDGDVWIRTTFTAPVPEPTTLALFGLGAVGILVTHRRRKARRGA